MTDINKLAPTYVDTPGNKIRVTVKGTTAGNKPLQVFFNNGTAPVKETTSSGSGDFQTDFEIPKPSGGTYVVTVKINESGTKPAHANLVVVASQVNNHELDTNSS